MRQKNSTLGNGLKKRNVVVCQDIWRVRTEKKHGFTTTKQSQNSRLGIGVPHGVENTKNSLFSELKPARKMFYQLRYFL